MGAQESSKKEFGYFTGEEMKGESRRLRCTRIPEDEPLKSIPFEGIDTLLKVYHHTIEKMGPNYPMLGTRIKNNDGTFGNYKWKSYNEVKLISEHVAKCLLHFDMCNEIEDYDGKKMKVLGIYSKNREEWTMSEIACWYSSTAVISFYDTLGNESIEFMIGQTQLRTICLSNENIEKIINLKKTGKLSTLQFLISFDSLGENVKENGAEIGLEIFTFEELVKKGEDLDVELQPSTPETVETLCYTSGTTGMPKGVRLTHKNNLAAASGFMKLGMIPTHIKNEVYISYLPLAHMLERLVVNTCIINGYSIGYFQGNILKIKEDLAALKPTKFVSVPRLFNKFYSILSSKMNEKTGFTEKLVKKAVETKLKNLRTKGVVKHNLYDQLVFKKMKAVLGGRVSWMLSGGAPIAGEVLEMLQICFSCKIVEGYGQTETGASGCVTDLKETRSGNIGAPMLCCEVKLVDVAEMNYFSTDMVDGKNVPRGEICMKGPNVMDCYFQQKEKTEETIDKDGWLHTGDVGAIIEGGCVKIIDRMKNLFKMAQGEYVAVEKLENKYIQSPFVSQIFVYGNAYQHYLVAIIVPEQETVIKWADEKEAEQDYEGLCHNTDLKSDILDNMINLGREAKFNGFEFVKDAFITSEQFSVENNTMTPTFKIKRREAFEKFEQEINFLYHTSQRKKSLKQFKNQ